MVNRTAIQHKSPHKKVLILADPWEKLDHKNDSTLYLCEYGHRILGLDFIWASPENVFVKDNRFYISIEGPLTFKTPDNPKLLHIKKEIPLNTFSSIHWRLDPPVTLENLKLWQLLHQSGLKIINPPQALLTWNEKFSPLRYPHFSLKNMIALKSIHFIAHLNDKTKIFKASSEAASRSVYVLEGSKSEQIQKISQSLTHSSPYWIMQDYNKIIQKIGETRAFMMNGKVMGALKKIPKPHSLIMDMDNINLKPTLQMSSLTLSQNKIAKIVGKDLKNDGIWLSSIDFIDDKILEINVTSVGLIKWYDKTLGKPQLANEYWKFEKSKR